MLQSASPGSCSMRFGKHLVGSLMALALVFRATSSAWAACENTGVPGTPYQGYGAGATGGVGQTVYTVTSLLDSGTGTLREAIDQSNSYTGRCVSFGGLTGTITLQTPINVR